MTTLHTPEARNNFNTTGFSDDVFRKMIDEGFTVKDIEALYSRLEYRKQYNQRPEVRAARADYNRRRNEKFKLMATLLK